MLNRGRRSILLAILLQVLEIMGIVQLDHLLEKQKEKKSKMRKMQTNKTQAQKIKTNNNLLSVSSQGLVVKLLKPWR